MCALKIEKQIFLTLLTLLNVYINGSQTICCHYIAQQVMTKTPNKVHYSLSNV